MECDSMALGQRIKQIRLERGETTSEFAKHFTASKGTVSKWENGKYEPNRKRLKKIAKLGNTTVDELLHGKPSGMTTALEIMDYYIEHYTKLEHNDTVRKLKEIRTDMENAEEFERSERVEELINNLFDVKHELEGDLETVLNLVDFYIMHYEKLGKRGLAGAMRELQTDINNALNIGDD